MCCGSVQLVELASSMVKLEGLLGDRYIHRC